jgi:hypothetical protein
MDRFRACVRELPECKPWFDFADHLNRLTLNVLRTHEVPIGDPRRVAISAFFIRAQQSFQAALILAERGMIGDARTVLRSAVEGAIALFALAADPTFVDQLVAAYRKHQLTVATLLLEDPDYRSELYSPEDIARMEATVSKIKALKGQSGKDPKAIRWDQVAKKHCETLYHMLYRSLSADGVHATVDSLNRYLESGTNMQITSLKVGPDVAGMVDTLFLTCLSLLWAIEPFARAFDATGLADQLQKELQRFCQLPRNEPIV